MDFGAVFPSLPGTPVGSARPFSDWVRAAAQVCTTLARAGFRAAPYQLGEPRAVMSAGPSREALELGEIP
jgi:hypothetical protein